jgi:hypothetical protein
MSFYLEQYFQLEGREETSHTWDTRILHLRLSRLYDYHCLAFTVVSPLPIHVYRTHNSPPKKHTKAQNQVSYHTIPFHLPLYPHSIPLPLRTPPPHPSLQPKNSYPPKKKPKNKTSNPNISNHCRFCGSNTVPPDVIFVSRKPKFATFLI